MAAIATPLHLFSTNNNPFVCRKPNFSTSIPSAFSVSSKSYPINSNASLSFIAPLEAILFDIDGTLCDSDPLHFYAFRDMLHEIGFNDGSPIDEEFFINNISGKHNEELCDVLLPEWEVEKAMKFMVDKEALFRRLAAEQLEPISGLDKLCKWVEDRGLKRAAVTNAPRSNAELLISMLKLEDFFEVIILAEECARAKPFPDPYVKALNALQISPNRTFVFEDSVSGIKAANGAGMPAVGMASRNPEQMLLDAGATFVIKDYNDPKLWGNLEEIVQQKLPL
ncbi:haloacid dehalogenase-like hydrolase domain-containing protein Sgpp [Cynara cardunculus var. scolymus]|nr:haloacid dehalogenase-like hydrolase domain-containing protein Sgpp [Cynara cardunculus var. scolymus]XP_024987561.1 haloacid dehalogenase-like hydrolase domain-containing protein Sgpp [Cynara cardunculus var. scolymus]XP_024987562.1 haloacid dehalogenase-like hydrolase domain-containing protein Sgpp [Cynara cardunculus var. scolymus]